LENITNTYADIRVEELHYIGLKNIYSLTSALKTHSDAIIRIFKTRVKPGKTSSLSRGISLFYLVQVVIATQGNVSTVLKAFKDLHINDPNRDMVELAKTLIEVVNPTQSTQGSPA
jgi:hypothetical protein